MKKILYTPDGIIQAIGEVPSEKQIDDTTFPDDFYNTFALGKYKVQEDDEGKPSIIEVPGFQMPQKQIYNLDEIKRMSADQLEVLMQGLQSIIAQKQVAV